MPTTLTRSILGVIVPGIVAVAPWILLLGAGIDGYIEFYAKFKVLVNACLLAFVVIVGSVLDGLGSHLEVRWDKEREAEYAINHNWYAYLSHVLEKEPVGFRYISRLVTILSFELSMMYASISFGLAVTILLSQKEMGAAPVLLAMLLTVGIPMYFHWQARITHRVINVTRREINARLPGGA